MASSQDGDIEEAIGKLATLLNLQKTAVGAATEESEQGAGSDVVPSASDERQAKAQGRSRGGGGGRSRSRSRSRSRNHRSGGEDYSGSDNDSVSSYSGSSYSGSSRSYSSDGSRSPSTGSRSTGSFSSDDEEGNSEPRSGSRSPSQSHSRSQRGGGGGGGSVPRSSTSRRSRPASAATTRASSSGWGLTHPRPVDLWRAAHEAKDPPKKPVTLTNDQWKELVHRLNDSSRTKHIYLMQAQHKQIADELRGLRFSPQICQRSREIASRVPTLPQRIHELMRFKKARQDKLRHDLAQEEFAEVTFHPKINARSRDMVRKVENLTHYGQIQRMRRKQRARIMQEVQDRELTFSPQINRKSLQILHDRRASGRGSRPTLQARQAAHAKRQKAARAREQAIREGRVPPPVPYDAESVVTSASMRSLKAGARTQIPGHEEENFSPVINKRSRRLKRRGSAADAGVTVFDRLYQKGVERTTTRIRHAEMVEAAVAPLVASERMAKRRGATRRKSRRSMAGTAARDAFNTVVFHPTAHAFILRKLQNQAGSGAV